MAAVGRAAAALAGLGHTVEPTDFAPLDDERLQLGFLACFTSWVARELDEWTEWTGDPVTEADVEAATWIVAEMGRAVSAAAYLAGLEQLRGAARTTIDWWEGTDVLLTPTLPEPPPRLGDVVGTADDPLRGLVRAGELVGFTQPFNVSGQPAISAAWLPPRPPKLADDPGVVCQTARPHGGYSSVG